MLFGRMPILHFANLRHVHSCCANCRIPQCLRRGQLTSCCAIHLSCYCCCLLLETIALHCNAVSYPDALPWLLAVLGRFFAFLCPDDATGCGVMGECEWTECEAGWRFFLWVQWRIDTEIFSGSLASLEYCWRGNPPQPQSNQDTPWFSSSLDCQVK